MATRLIDSEAPIVRPPVMPAVNLGDNSGAPAPVGNLQALNQNVYQDLQTSGPTNDQNPIGNFFAGVVNAVVPGSNLGDSNSTFKDFGQEVGLPMVALVAAPAIASALGVGGSAAATAATDLTPAAVQAATVAATPAAAGAAGVAGITEIVSTATAAATAGEKMGILDTILGAVKTVGQTAQSASNTVSQLNKLIGLPDKTTNPMVITAANNSTASDNLGQTGGATLNRGGSMPVMLDTNYNSGVSPLWFVIGALVLIFGLKMIK